jgi:hypothetical protein
VILRIFDQEPREEWLDRVIVCNKFDSLEKAIGWMKKGLQKATNAENAAFITDVTESGELAIINGKLNYTLRYLLYGQPVTFSVVNLCELGTPYLHTFFEYVDCPEQNNELEACFQSGKFNPELFGQKAIAWKNLRTKHNAPHPYLLAK